METYVIASAVLALWTSSLLGMRIGQRNQARAVTFQRSSAALAAVLAVLLAFSSNSLGGDGLVMADRLGAAISVFATMMLVILGTFAARSLAADPRAGRFFAASNALTGSTLLLATANRAWLMAVAWIAISVSTLALIAYDGRPGATLAARRAARNFVLGDIGVILAAVIASLAASGPGDLQSTAQELASSGIWAPMMAVTLLLGVLVRSAQLPFSGWLAGSVAAPTPVSAMLHAGVVNGSAILLIRWNPVIAGSLAITIAVVLVSIAGIAVGMAVGRTRPDVKSGLAWTTVAQMGFMILQCAVGLVGPAVIHLMAHGLFKSSLFLGAGSGLDGGGHHRHPGASRPTAAQFLAAGVTATAIAALAMALVQPDFLDHPAAALPITFAVFTLAYGLWQWWARTESTRAWYLRFAPVPVVAIGFTLLTAISSQVDHWIGTAGAIVPEGATWLAVSAVAVIGALALGAGLLASRMPALANKVWIHIASASAPTANSLRSAPRTADTNTLSTGRSSADPTRRERIRETIATAAADIAPSFPLERFVATNPLLSSQDLPLESAVERAAIELGVRAEFDEATYRGWFADGRISIDELRRAAAEHLADNPGGGGFSSSPTEAAIETLVEELLEAEPEELPPTRPVLMTEWHDLAAGTSWADTVDELSAWWCAAYLSDHPASPLPGRDTGLFTSWRSLAGNDPRSSRQMGASFTNLLAALPERADDAVLALLVELGVDRPDHVEYLNRHLHRHRGWTSALIRASGTAGEDLIAFLAIRLCYEAAFLSSNTPRLLAAQTAADHPAREFNSTSGVRMGIWREAYEIRYRDDLLSSLTPAAAETTTTKSAVRPATQVVCCIDPRSEGLRRHLESTGAHETIGFAGFFGLQVAVSDLDATGPVGSCPVILEPQATAVETALAPASRGDRVTALHSIFDVFAATKRSAAAPFAMAETLGWASGAVTTARTLAPATSAAAGLAVRRAILPTVETAMVPASENWWPLDTQIGIAASILKTTGLHRNPARLVMLCGHTSRHVNNLHRSSLDCGACGGRGGGNNARIAANLLNDPEVRSGLEAEGIALPADTYFLAAVHDTTSDRVEVLDRYLVPASHTAELASLERDLVAAGEGIAAERGINLPATVGRTVGEDAPATQRRGDDWAQVIAEWGLVANAAIVIGPRSLTSSTDLGRRVFLHTYDAFEDLDGSILAGILGGPVQVAHWISSQYRFSTIDKERLGAGTKTAHNLLGGIGVLEGAGGDIRLGLPLESVSCAGSDVHEAMRLLVVIDAEPSVVDQALEATPGVAELVDNGWIRLAARTELADTSPSAWRLRSRGGGWLPWQGSTSTAELESTIDVTESAPTSAPVSV